ncbi:hypothetical protein Tco_0266936 [Tanacetum coccineum]
MKLPRTDLIANDWHGIAYLVRQLDLPITARHVSFKNTRNPNLVLTLLSSKPLLLTTKPRTAPLHEQYFVPMTRLPCVTCDLVPSMALITVSGKSQRSNRRTTGQRWPMTVNSGGQWWPTMVNGGGPPWTTVEPQPDHHQSTMVDRHSTVGLTGSGCHVAYHVSCHLSCLLKDNFWELALNLTVHCCGLEFRVLNGYDQKSFDEERGLN